MDACKSSEPPFYMNTSLTPLRNKILYGLRLLNCEDPAIAIGIRSSPTGDVTMHIPLIGLQTGEASGEEADEPTDGLTRGHEVADARASSRSTSRRGDRRIIINTKQDCFLFHTESP